MQPQSPKKLKSIADVELALHELSWIDHQLAHLRGKANQELDELKKRQADRFVMMVDGELAPILERRRAVEGLLRAWCLAHVREHLEKDKKSVKLAHGVVGLRSSALTVEFAEGQTEASVLDKLDELTAFRELVAKLLDRIFSKHVISTALTFEPRISFAKLKVAVDERRVDAELLGTIGLVIRAPEDHPTVTPSKYVVAGQD